MTKAVKAKDYEGALELRGSEFKEILDGFFATSILGKESDKLPVEKVRSFSDLS